MHHFLAKISLKPTPALGLLTVAGVRSTHHCKVPLFSQAESVFDGGHVFLPRWHEFVAPDWGADVVNQTLISWTRICPGFEAVHSCLHYVKH